MKLLIPLLFLFATQISWATSCKVASSPKEYIKLEAPQIEQWSQEIAQTLSICNAKGCIVWPNSMKFRFSYNDRYFIVNAAQRLRKSIFKSAPVVFKDVSNHVNNPHNSDDLDSVLNRVASSIKEEHSYSRATEAEVQSGIQRITGFWNRIKGSANFKNFSLRPIIDSADKYQKAVLALQEKYGTDLVNEEVLIGAGFGNLASRVILDTIGTQKGTNKALDAISLLHPLTDNALDHGLDVGQAMKKITDYIDGSPRDLQTETQFETLVLDLIGDIFAEYPRDEHPEVVTLLKGLHMAQIKSVQVQRKGDADFNKIMEMSVLKGGYTGLLMAYLAKGRLTKEEAALFFKGGSLFQLGDDLLDVKEDLKDNTKTIWTLSLGNKADFKKAFQVFLKLQSELEAQVAQIQDASLRENLKTDIESGFKFYLLSAYLNPTLAPRIGEYLSDKIPLSQKNLREILFNTFRNLTSIQDGDAKLMAAMKLYGRVFDHHFLGNQYKTWEEKQSERRLRPYRVSHWNPLFAAVKFETMITEFVKKRNSAQMVNIVLTMGVGQLLMNTSLKASGFDDLVTWTTLSSAFVAINAMSNLNDQVLRRPMVWLWLSSIATTTGAYISTFF